MVEIGPLTATEIDFAVSLTDHEKWGYLQDDFKRLIEISPEGCFLARIDGRPTAIITSIRYDDFAFVGTLITIAENRGQGIGETLMRHTLEVLGRQGVNYFEIDGVFQAVSFYRRLGFRDKYLSLRFIKSAAAGQTSNRATKLSKKPLGNLLDLDRQLTGLNRSGLIESYYADSIYMATKTSRDNSHGFAFLVPCQGNTARLASLVSTDAEIAEQLLTETLEANPDRTILAGVPEINQESARMFRKHGFLYRQPSVRMFLGSKRSYEKNIYTIASADKG